MKFKMNNDLSASRKLLNDSSKTEDEDDGENVDEASEVEKFELQ